MTSPAVADASTRWRWLLRLAVFVLIGVSVLVHLFVQVPIPPLIIFIVIFCVVLYLLTREGRARTVGVVLGGIGSLLFVLGNLPVVLEDVGHPDSGLGFVASGAGVVGGLLGLVAMLGALLHWPSAPVRPIFGLGAAAIAAVIGVGVVATIRVEDDEPQEGDVVLVAEDADFIIEGSDPEREEDVEITVEQGRAVVVEDEDLYRHTFTIEALDLDEEIQAGVTRRVVIDAEPGQYEFVCDVEGHEDDMRGTLMVR